MFPLYKLGASRNIQNKKNFIKLKPNYEDVAFVTLTNSGYIDYTLNCLESLNRIHSKLPLISYCLGVNGYNILKEKGTQFLIAVPKLKVL